MQMRLRGLQILAKSDASAELAEAEVSARQANDVSIATYSAFILHHPPAVERPDGVHAAVPVQRDAEGCR